MTNYLKKKLSLSEKGASDLVKASIACTLTDLSLMFPIGIVYLLLKEILLSVLNGEMIHVNLIKYIVFSIAVLALIYVLEYNQYNKTFLASYNESENKRISLAEILRILPLSFFGRRDLSDLTTTIMGDCAGLETAFSHYIPELIGSVISIIVAGLGMVFMNWKMSIALLWVVPVAFIIVILGKKNQDKVIELSKKIKLDYSDSIQECIETVREIKANNMSKSYLKKFDDKLKKSEKVQLKAEFNTAKFVVSAQLILRVGMATVVIVGSTLLLKGETDLLTFLVFMIAASRIFDPLAATLINLAAMFGSLIEINRMKEIEDQKVQKGTDRVNYNGCDIAFNHVGFSYNKDEVVIKDISFTAKQGQVTALVGPSGGGKSTAAKLAARFWDVNKGEITLGGIDISKVEPETLLKKYNTEKKFH